LDLTCLLFALPHFIGRVEREWSFSCVHPRDDGHYFGLD
jgi:hypothetical protein